MGLLLSILVTCVGVVELLDLCRNVKRRVRYQHVEHPNLATVHHQHLKELEGIRDRLEEQLKHLPTLRLNSHEDIEVDGITRQFISSEGIRKSKAQECLPDFLTEESSDVQKYVSNEQDVFRKKLGHAVVEVDGELFYRRSPSPFPSFELTAPRNSICSELLDDSSVAEVDERSRSISPVEVNNNSEKVDVILSHQPHISTEYWCNNTLAASKKKTKSRSPSPGLSNLKKDRRRSLSDSHTVDFNQNVQVNAKTASSLELSKDEISSSSDEFMEVEAYTEEMKNSLDGVDKNKGCTKKKYIKKKRIKKSDSNNEQVAEGSGPKPGEPFWVNR